MDTAQVVVEMVSERNGNNEIMEENVIPPRIEQTMERSGNNEIVEQTKGSDKTILEETEIETVLDLSGNNEIMEEPVSPPTIVQQVVAPWDAKAFSRMMFQKLGQVPQQYGNGYIYRVNKNTRWHNEKHYEPFMLSIGPYNMGKPMVQQTQGQKMQCLNKIIEIVTEKTGVSKHDQLVKYFGVLRKLEGRARECYADPISLNTEDFLKMLLLDAAIVIDTLQTLKLTGRAEDPSLYIKPIPDNLQHDMLLLENQIPLFVLESLHEEMVSNDEQHPFALFLSAALCIPIHELIRPPPEAARDLVVTVICINDLFNERGNTGDESLNMLEIFPDLEVEVGRVDGARLKSTKHLLDFCYKSLLKEDMLDEIDEDTRSVHSSRNDYKYKASYSTIHSAKELRDAGVIFRTSKRKKFGDIRFYDGILEIPVITFIPYRTEGLLRNLIAYEVRDNVDKGRRFLSDYVIFMDGLINTPEDVKVLRLHGIIAGDDLAITTFFNKSSEFAVASFDYYYSDLLKDLDMHCTKRKSSWKYKLKRNCVIVSSVIFTLTVIQTVFTVISYWKG